jgi:hypothetical protein
MDRAAPYRTMQSVSTSGGRGPKRLEWGDGDQIDFYDQPAQVDRSVGAIDAWFKMHLANSAREPGMA